MTRPKKFISKQWRKQKGLCYLCGNGMNREDPSKTNFATIDHVIPKSIVRTIPIVYLDHNKKLACRICNEIKGSRPARDVIKQLRQKVSDHDRV